MNHKTENNGEKALPGQTVKGTRSRKEQPKKGAEQVSAGTQQRKRSNSAYRPRRKQAAQVPGEPAVPMKIYPLGGLGEVGKNITLYECREDMLLVD